MVAVKKLPPQKEYYTYSDYRSWETDVRYELMNGVAYALASPSPKHQRIIGKLYTQFDKHLNGKKCEVFLSPLDVRLNYDTKDDTVVQPDLFIVCDKNKIDNKGCKGVPDLMIEVLSQSNRSWDLLMKYNRYLKAGVPEYWVVDPDARLVHVFILKDENYIAKNYGDDAVITSTILPECKIDMTQVFEPLTLIENNE